LSVNALTDEREFYRVPRIDSAAARHCAARCQARQFARGNSLQISAQLAGYAEPPGDAQPPPALPRDAAAPPL